jgi:hypothetical protein
MRNNNDRLFGNPLSIFDISEVSEGNFKIQVPVVVEKEFHSKFSQDLNIQLINHLKSEEIQDIINDNNYEKFVDNILSFQGKTLKGIFLAPSAGEVSPQSITWYWTDLYVAAYVGFVVVQVLSQIDVTPKIDERGMGGDGIQSIANVLGAAKIAGGSEFGIAVGKYLNSEANNFKIERRAVHNRGYGLC